MILVINPQPNKYHLYNLFNHHQQRVYKLRTKIKLIIKINNYY